MQQSEKISRCASPSQPQRHNFRVLLLVLLALFSLTGCVSNNTGTLIAKVEPQGHVTLITIYGIGLMLNQDPLDQSIGFGLNRRTYNFASTHLEEGWHALHLTLPTTTAFAKSSLHFGVEVYSRQPHTQLTLGVENRKIHAQVSATDSVLLLYQSGKTIRLDKIINCEEARTCSYSEQSPKGPPPY